jgi:hypothetical protein
MDGGHPAVARLAVENHKSEEAGQNSDWLQRGGAEESRLCYVAVGDQMIPNEKDQALETACLWSGGVCSSETLSSAIGKAGELPQGNNVQLLVSESAHLLQTPTGEKMLFLCVETGG